jgi:hypothetical protein
MTPALSDYDFFRMRLDAMIDARHELVRKRAAKAAGL